MNHSCYKYIVFLFIFNPLFSEPSELQLMDLLCDSKRFHFEETDDPLRKKDLNDGILSRYNVEKTDVVSDVFHEHSQDQDNDFMNGIISFCRAHAVLNSSSVGAFKHMDISAINSSIIDVLRKAEDDCKVSSKCGISPTDPDFMKIRLLAFSLSWNDYLGVFKSVFSTGVFHNFSNEESWFVLYSHPMISSFSWFFVKKEDKNFYVECLAGALRTFIREKYKVEVDFGKDGSKATTAIARTYLEQIGCLSSTSKKDD